MMEINIYIVYKIILIALSLWQLIMVINRLIPLIKYTKYLKYSKFIPNFITEKLIGKGGEIINKQVKQNNKDLLINGVLLIAVFILNITLWIL